MKRSIPIPTNALLSYHYYRDFDLDRLPHLTIIGDSGAYSAKTQGATINVDELAEWGIKWRHRLAWLASLDVIGDPDASYRNWRRIVNDYGLPAVPTVHFGAAPAEIDRYADHGCDFIGLGGLVGVPAARQMRWLVQMFRYAATHHPTMRFHGWGCTSRHHFKLPFFSVDSSSWNAGMRYGTMRLVHPSTGKATAYALNGREAYSPAASRLLVDYYGIAPGRVASSTETNQRLLTALALLSASAQEQFFRRKHGNVSPPTWVPTLDRPGPHIHLASTASTHFKQLDNMTQGGLDGYMA